MNKQTIDAKIEEFKKNENAWYVYEGQEGVIVNNVFVSFYDFFANDAYTEDAVQATYTESYSGLQKVTNAGADISHGKMIDYENEQRICFAWDEVSELEADEFIRNFVVLGGKSYDWESPHKKEDEDFEEKKEAAYNKLSTDAMRRVEQNEL
jgi:hypothetical protein